MYLSLNLFFSLFHFVLTYVFFMTMLLTNNIQILLVLLILMSFVKYMYYLFGRCIITLCEKNDYYATMATHFSKTLTTATLKDVVTEEILINTGLLIVLNKLLGIMVYNYYRKNT